MMTKIYLASTNMHKASIWMALSPSRNSKNILNTINKTIHRFKRWTSSGKQLKHCIINNTYATGWPSALSVTSLTSADDINHAVQTNSCSFLTSLYAIQRNPEYFSNFNSICPEQCLVDPASGVTEKVASRALQALGPFGAGLRTCVRWKLGWMERATIDDLCFCFLG